MSLRNWFVKLPVPRFVRIHGKPGIGRYAVVGTSSNGKYHGLPFVVIDNKNKIG